MEKSGKAAGCAKAAAGRKTSAAAAFTSRARIAVAFFIWKHMLFRSGRLS
jgi:hypothetical protein